MGRAWLIACLLPALGCDQVGPSQIADFTGTWTGTLSSVSCVQSSGCYPKACLNEADFARNTTAMFTLTVHQTGRVAIADLIIEEQNAYVLYRETGQLSGRAADELELAGNMTRTYAGQVVAVSPILLSSTRLADSSPPRIGGSMTRRQSDSEGGCTTTTGWRFEGASGGQ